MRVTQRDIAREAGVSQAVVSDVLHGRARGRVRPETRERILEAARTLAYRPNASAQALRSRQSSQVAYLTTRQDVDGFTPFAEEVVGGLVQTLTSHGLRLVLEVADSYQAVPARLEELVASGICDSGIVRVFEDQEALWPALKRLNVPMVVIGQCPDPELVSVAHDVPGIIRAAQQLLAERGHDRIGLITGKRRGEYFRLIERAWHDGLTQAGRSANWSAAVAGREDASAQAATWLSEPDGPRAIVCLNERTALGVTRAAIRCGMRIGEDLDLVVIGSRAQSWLYEPGTLLFGTNLNTVGRRAAEALVAAMEQRPEPRPLRLLPELVCV